MTSHYAASNRPVNGLAAKETACCELVQKALLSHHATLGAKDLKQALRRGKK